MRIVSLLPSATELLFAIGAGPEVVGVTHECDHPEPARLLPALTSDATASAGLSAAEIDRHIRHALHQGSSIYALREDLLAALQPDLIVTQELCAVCAVAYDEVERAVRRLPGEVPVLSLEPSSLDDIVETVGSVGRATGHGAGAQQLMTTMRGRITAVRELPRPQPPPRVACIEWTDPVMAGGHWVPEMVRVAGGVDPLGREGERSEEVSWQAVLDALPEVMVLMPCGFGLDRSLRLAADITTRDGFAALPCARSGRIAAVDGSSYFNRPGPRIVDGLEILARILRTPVGESLGAGAAWVGVPELSGPAWPRS